MLAGGDNGDDASSAVEGTPAKGTLAGAAAELLAVDPAATDLKGDSLSSGGTDETGALTGLRLGNDHAGLVLVEVTAEADTVDLSTGTAPVLTHLRTLVDATQAREGAVYPTPLTTLAVAMAAANAGRSAGGFGGDDTAPVTEAEVTAALDAAVLKVVDMFGLGLLSGVDPFTTPPLLIEGSGVDAGQVTRYRTAIEALAVLADKLVVDVGAPSAQAAFEALAADIADGRLDGTDLYGDPVPAFAGFTAEQLAGFVEIADLGARTIPGTATAVDATAELLVAEMGATGNPDADTSGAAAPPAGPARAVADVDRDGVPDYREDANQGGNDDDGDGLANFRDPDNDSDGDGKTNPDAPAPLDAAPTLAPIADATVLEDASTGPIALTLGDADTPADSLTVTVVSDDTTLVPDANLVLGGSGTERTLTLTVTPAPDAFGTATLTVTVSDGSDSASRELALLVEPVNDPPRFTPGADPKVLEDAGPQSVEGWAEGLVTGPANEADQSLTGFTVISNTAPGLFAAAPSVDAAGTLTFTPAPTVSGTAEVTVTLTDDAGTANGGSDTSAGHTFTIAITAVDEAPSAADDAATLPEDAPSTPIAVLANDTFGGDGPGTVALAIATPPGHGTATVDDGGTAGDPSDDRIEYAPDADYNGTDSLVYRIEDGDGDSATAAVTVTVTSRNDPPSFASPTTASVLENHTTAYTATASDPDPGDTPTFSISGGDDASAFIIDPDTGALSFTTPPDFEAPADANADNAYLVQLSANDGHGGVETQIVTITITDESLLAIEVSYPTPNANLGGQVTQTTVTANIIDTEDGEVEFDDVSYIDVNGVLANQDIDDPVRWSARVPVGKPDDTLTVTVEAADGEVHRVTQDVNNSPLLADVRDVGLELPRNRAPVLDANLGALVAVGLAGGDLVIVSDARIGHGPGFVYPESIAVDEANNRVLVVDAGIPALLAVDLTTGDRTTISSENVGSGPDFRYPEGIALDLENDRALVGNDLLLAVDLTTGNRTIVSGAGTGDGPRIDGPLTVALDAPNHRALVGDFTLDALVAVDLTSGDRIIVSADGVGSGPSLTHPVSIEIDTNGNRALVVDSNLGAVIAVDLANGDRAIVSGDGAGNGPVIGSPRGIALDVSNNRALVVRNYDAALLGVNLMSGDRIRVDDHSVGSGLAFGRPQSIAFDSQNNRVLVVDWILDALVAVDLATGDRTILSDTDTGAGPSFSLPSGVALRASNDHALVIDVSSDVMLDVNLITGNRAVVSGAGIGSGPSLEGPFRVELDAFEDQGLVVDGILNALLAVSLSSGDRDIVSDAATGIGPNFIEPYSVVLGAQDDHVLVLDAALAALLAVDLNSGDRVVVSSENIGAGPEFGSPFGLDLEVPKNRALVVTWNPPRLLAVDLTSGDRTVLSDESRGGGPNLIEPEDVALDVMGNRAIVIDVVRNAVFVIDVETGERAIASK